MVAFGLNSRMNQKMKLLKSFSKFQDQKVGLMLVACFLASMAFLALSKPYNEIPITISKQKSSVHAVSASIKAENNMKSHKIGVKSTISEITKPLCDISQPRSEICEMDGDIRVHGNSSTITFVTPPQIADSARNESYRIRPYARKGDGIAMNLVREVFVRSSDHNGYPHCTLNHTIPAIVFSTSAYAGNIFHDFTDILIPLFLTSRQYDGEVQFLVTNMNRWWIRKYQTVLEKLSRYQVIDFDKDHSVHCFSHVTVGLRCHKELSIDPSRAPNGISMIDFTQFMRSSYNLKRDTIQATSKPRLMIISRTRARAFTNVNEIVQLANELGYEPVVAEANMGSNVTQFAEIVNSCDAIMGVHGAGFTNMVYLPRNATVIQIVPWGGLGWVCRYDFGYPAKDMGLNYLHYEIKEEESSLIEVYPRDHQVFKDPLSYHKLGWNAIRAMFMDKQNVKLDVNRFRPVLLEALELVRKQQGL